MESIGADLATHVRTPLAHEHVEAMTFGTRVAAGVGEGSVVISRVWRCWNELADAADAA